VKPLPALLVVLLVARLGATPAKCAEVAFTTAPIFSDHMVLQRNREVPIWGRSQPGDEITLEWQGRQTSATTDADGRWVITLEPLAATAEPREMIIRSAGAQTERKIADVVVGDVWFCSGQSNMHLPMTGAEHAREEIAAAEVPGVRFFSCKHQFAQQPLEEIDGHWNRVSPATAGECSAVAYYFARDLERHRGLPIGVVVSAVGGTRIESWMSREALAAGGDDGALLRTWADVSAEEFAAIATAYRAYQHQRDRVHPQAVREAKARGESPPPGPPRPKRRCHDCPTALHNGMIAPLGRLSIRGVIWYQGESNSGRPAAYEGLLPALIAEWRRMWGAEMPFLFVQLAPYRDTHPAFREAQHRIWRATPGTAMVVTTDVGDAATIHPIRKRPVGERLAMAARALAYGEDVEYSGPIFNGVRLDGDRAVISFAHVGGGLVSHGDVLTGFTIAGADGKFVPARAEIDGATVVVRAEAVPQPAAVRYGWAHVPDCTLFNREGLPAAPFRSDQPQ
jgi:sialate O-acetylesterase